VAAVLIVVAVISGVMQSRAEQAAQDFYGASELFKRQQWSEALESFTAIADQGASSTYGRLAQLYAARSALRAGDAARSVELYRTYLGSPIADVGVEQLARLDYATALQKTGDADAARAELEKALELAGPARSLAVIRLAGIAAAAGDKPKAIELYKRYLADYPDGADDEVARAGLVALGEKPPAPAAPTLPPQLQLQ
jgi:tetratricopeptide (TPR) repeat protein